MAGRFDGKVAIVTGGTSGIGAAIASRLAAEGARVLVTDLNPPAVADERLAFHRTDVTDAAACAAMVAAAVERFGRLDILVNNAGIGALDETPDMADAVWDKVMAVNVSSIFYACRAAIPAMREGGGGAIVNVASVSGLGADHGMGVYNASKAAAVNYTRSLALDCARDGIRVNALCPGAIARTAMGVGSFGSAADQQSWIDAVPLGRLGTPEEMANVVAFLASDEASFMTGSIVTADGGTTACTGLPDVITQRNRRRAEQAAGA
ncbi:SDR family NAD(P)-dependent oxidoreductase [Sphingomonas solaris]|uniref:SDR family oxidoreductase n=1 Tax=Alterirhizorhabdus solaris TaxID=2529389 RepID=A0A558RB96_9SPHN|nr:SDR family oxidoreductase [Sphingomonas solaris]TVV76633.1 SDR family oxidoreductase [Sphingomonas solaris]